jgi:hypothetical protein
MRSSKVVSVYLFLAGLIFIIVGGANFIVPIEFGTRNGAVLGDNMSMLSEMRGFGALLFVSGWIILLGAFFKNLTYTSAFIAPLMYLFFGVGRVLSIVVDGMPADTLVKATVVEIVVGIVGAFIFFKYRIKQNSL